MTDILLRCDSSISLMMESEKRGHQVLYAEPKDLRLTERALLVNVKQVSVSRKGFHVHSEFSIPAERANCVFIRKDPPFDLEYLYLTYILEPLSKKTLVINSPAGIRNANEKIWMLKWVKWVPESLVTKDPEAILKFQEKISSDLILKPLHEKGGAGILFLPQTSNRRGGIANRATKEGRQTVIAQKFLKRGLKEGDKRIVVWDGEILGAFGRVPKPGEFRANLSLGGIAKKVKVSKREKQIVREMSGAFRKNGLIFVGLDLIDGFLTEVNVTSPAGIYDLHDLYGISIERRMIDWVESGCR